MTSQPAKLLRVLMVSTSYPANMSDWRGLFIRHLANALARRENLKLRLWAPPGEFPANADYIAKSSESQWLARLMQAGGIAHLMRTHPISQANAPIRLLWMLRSLYRREVDVDVLHINWLQNALALPNNGKPLLTTVLGTDMRFLRLPGLTHFLRRTFRGRRVMICPNARWMLPELERRFADLASIKFVPFGIEPRWFEVERNPDQPRKWVCVSRLTRDKIGMLFDWCEPFFKCNQRELHLFGPMQEQMRVPDWVHYHGPAVQGALCRQWFPAASGLITLSQHAEGWPQVMLEAMASGLPVIASRLPAHVDILQNGENGLICDNPTELGRAFTLLECSNSNEKYGLNARNWARRTIGTWDDCARRYADIYEELTATCA